MSLEEQGARINALELNMTKLTGLVESQVNSLEDIKDQIRESRIHTDKSILRITDSLNVVQRHGGLSIGDILKGIGATIAALGGAGAFATLLIYGVLHLAKAEAQAEAKLVEDRLISEIIRINAATLKNTTVLESETEDLDSAILVLNAHSELLASTQTMFEANNVRIINLRDDINSLESDMSQVSGTRYTADDAREDKEAMEQLMEARYGRP